MERRKPHRLLGRAVLALALCLVLGLVLIKVRYGRGAPYPDLSAAPRVAAADVKTLASLDLPPGNVTSSRDGRIFFNTHPFAQSHRFTDAFLFELVDGSPRPFPDAASQSELQFVFGMTVDAQNRLWLTCPATLDRARTRLIAYDLATNHKVLDRELPRGVGRFAQDLRVSPDGQTLFLADTGAFRLTHAAIVVVDVRSWTARELLAADPSTQAQDLTIGTRAGPYRLGFGLLSFQVGVDGIALSPDGDWLYFATMSHGTLYRVRAALLLDATLPPGELARQVEKVGPKPLSDGIALAPDGAVLITDIEHGGIARLDTHGHLETLVRMEQVIWADGVHVTASGDVLFTDSAIPAYIDQLLRPPALARLRAGKPYHIYRFRLPGT